MRQRRSLHGIGVALAVLGAANIARAQSTPDLVPPVPAPVQTVPDAANNTLPLEQIDRDLVNEAGQMGKAEVAAGRIALQRSQDPVILQFAETVVSEHGQQYARLLGIAERGIVSLDSLNATHEHMLAELREAPDEEFDRAYIRTAVRGHMDSLARLQRMAQVSSDAEVRGYAEQTLEVVQRHLDQAKRIDASMTRLTLRSW